MNKLTYLTFSGPVDVPGITLPAGTYRFELADPDNSRRVIKVADKEGTKSYGMFLSIPNQRMTPTDDPVVMFKETASGAPPAIQVWFYPGESTGYEFVYPHDQALKLAKATHQPVLSYSDKSTASTTEADRYSSMKNAEVTRIDETDKAVAADASAAPPARTAATTAQPSSTSVQPPTAEPTSAPRPSATAQSTTSAQPTTAPRSTPAATTATTGQPAPTTARRNNAATAVGTSGTTGQNASSAPRKQLPGTASTLPLMELLTALMIAGGLGAHAARKALEA